MDLQTADTTAPTLHYEPISSVPPSLCQLHDSFKHDVYTAVYTVIAVLGLPAHSLALYVFTRHYKKNNSSRSYCINLACADLLYILTLPLQIVYYSRNSDWPFGDALCRLTIYTFYVNLYGSIFFLTAISVNRYLAVARPMQQWRGHGKWTRVVCVSIWAFTALCSLPIVLTGTYESDGRVRCLEPARETANRGIMNNVSFAIGFVVPLVVIVFCYAALLKHLMQGRGTGGAQRRMWRTQRRIWALSITVVFLFVALFLPYHVVRSISLYAGLQAELPDAVACEKYRALQPTVVATVCMATANGCFDPVIYFFCSKHFRSFLCRVVYVPIFQVKSKREHLQHNPAVYLNSQFCNSVILPPPQKYVTATMPDVSAQDFVTVESMDIKTSEDV
ncbi:cysteinyl leukotriene receptor 1-like [Petromyzon marinus]|uniref:Cysteinyl leukotriene receptor 1-like n=2 Tax=Petromyzon marinus TaxID=7757 RepID=A0AAJ7TZ00_PETMA|nr:cysteinyl leukotriene receptor 1-like [Petromyzon marinus]